MSERTVERLLVLWVVVVVCLAVGALLSDHQQSEDALYARTRDSVLFLLNPDNLDSGGTGFAVKTPSGHTLTLTNAHICRMTERDYVMARQGESLTRLYILAISSDNDLCVVEPLPGQKGLEVAEQAFVYQLIYIVGHPLLRPSTLSKGYIIGQAPISPGGKEEDAFWTSAEIFPGNSGSPVIDVYGRVVGVLFAGDMAHKGYVVPLYAVRSFLSAY